MTATYTFDVFSTLDGYGSVNGGDWGGYWGKQGPELLDHRLASFDAEQRMVFGANTYRLFVELLGSGTEESVGDPWVTRMRSMPATVLSTTLEEPLDWPDATVVSGDAVDIVARLKEESNVPLRSHGSLSLNWALMAAGLVDRVQVTLFPVITGQTGWTRSSEVRRISTWSSWSTGRSTATPKSSSTDPPSIDLYGFEETSQRGRQAHIA